MVRAGRIYALPPCTSPSDYPFWKRHVAGALWFLAIFQALREIWGDAALFVPPSDHEALALTINSCRESCELR